MQMGAPVKVHTFGGTSSEPSEETVIADLSEAGDGLIRGSPVRPVGESSRALSSQEEIDARRAEAAAKPQRRRASPAAAPARRAAAPVAVVERISTPIDVTSDIALRARCLEMAAAGGLSNPMAVISNARMYLDFVMGAEEVVDGDDD
jgi:hypothetical protein